MSAYIIHLCVGKQMRGKGVARKLFYELNERTVNDFRGIRVRCRRDFESANIWQKLGFTAVREIPGRSKKGSTLTVWWFDHGHPDLFNQIVEQESPIRNKIAIDANIFIELRDPETVANRESKALLNEWLQEKIELCVTKELLNEINRNHTSEQRNKDRIFATTFTSLTCDNQIFKKTVDSLKSFLRIISESDKSDCRQLAWAIGAGVQFFVTHDKKLLKKEEVLFEHFGIRVIRPSYLIINQDGLVREAEYQPVRLTGTQLTHNRIHSDNIICLEDTFRANNETKSEFRKKLHPYLADPHKFETRTIEKDNEPLAIIIYDRKNPKELVSCHA